MSNQGDDCYFFFYSTCSKGESCPFRHCKAALGNETVCNLWQEGRCFRQICKFRHMEIDKKRSVIPCFWENQLSGCQKGNCAFHHNKGRYVDGVYMPPSNKQVVEPEPSETDLQLFQTPNKLIVTSSTHLREVIKAEAAENVPSPTHPPVVINAADDDEDDDDQISGEGDESKPSGQQGGHQGAQRVTTRKMEVLRTDAPSTGRSLAQRLGKRKVFSPETSLGEESIPVVKKTLSERLGKRIVTPIVGPVVQPKKSRVSRPLKDRLGLSPEQNSTETGVPCKISDKGVKRMIRVEQEPRTTCEALQKDLELADRAANPTTDFHIKTLQEIRQEKTSQRQEQEPKCLPIKSEDRLCLKSRLFIKPQPIHVKSLHEIQAEKKQLLAGAQKPENKVDKTDRVSRDLPEKLNLEDKNMRESEEKQRGQAGITWNNACEKEINPSHLTCTVASRIDLRKPLCVNLKETKKIAQSVEHVQIKTLEEIRKEKALKTQHNRQATDTNNSEPLTQLQVISSAKRILRLPKTQVTKETDQGISDANFQTNNTATALDTKTTVDLGPPVPAPVTTTEKVGSDKTLETQSLKSEDLADTQKEPSKIIPGKTSKGKPKVNMEPNLMKKQSPAKAVIKRKAQQSSPVAKVKPLNTTSTDEKNTTVLLPASDSSASQNELVTSTPSKLQKESCEVPASDPVSSSAVQTMVKTRRASVASSAKPSVLTEDDFDELIWDISDGKLGDEINLDPSKDEDDLLMELSEMIDS